MDLKEAGNSIYLVGDFRPTLGGSHLSLIAHPASLESIPTPAKMAPKIYQALHQTISSGQVKSAHDLSEGGLLVAAAEMCIGGRLGLDLSLSLDSDQASRSLFGETNGCILAEVALACAADFERQFAGLPLLKIGTVTTKAALKIAGSEILVDELAEAFNTTI
jgi:phosphoribosylformylglycinamidine synthase